MIPVDAGRAYTASAYVRDLNSDVVGAVSATAYVEMGWHDSSGALLSTSTSSAATLVLDTWVRPAVSAVAPPGATNVQVRVRLTNVVTGLDVLVDAVLLEPASSLRTYFDANAASQDYLWVGEPNQSVSLYYKDLLESEQRLAVRLHEFLPKDRDFRLIYTDETIRTFTGDRYLIEKNATEPGAPLGTVTPSDAPMGS